MIRLDSTPGRIVKRCMDVVASAVGLLVLAPLFGVIAAGIKSDSRGPVFFRQVRVGHRGKPFRIWKFRTMSADAEHNGPEIASAGDVRVTPVGRVLRRTKLDELPQLLNVLVGEMSLVGPRPELPSYVALYTDAERRVLDFVPGMTDPASLQFRNEGVLLAAEQDPLGYYRDVVMREKLALNLAYRRTATVGSDVWIILMTLAKLFG